MKTIYILSTSASLLGFVAWHTLDSPVNIFLTVLYSTALVYNVHTLFKKY